MVQPALQTRSGFASLAVVAFAVVVTGCGSSPLDLHTVDWKEASVPGSICGAVDPTGAVPLASVQLRNGEAYAKSHRWADYSIVEITGAWDRIVYGDVTGDGRDEASVGVYCSNGGGTAGGILAYARVVYTANQDAPSPRRNSSTRAPSR